MNILDFATTKKVTCTTHTDGKCQWRLEANGERNVESCHEEKTAINAAIDAKIAELQALDVSAEIAKLQQKKIV